MIRKPHNLVTGYWDDIEFFLDYAEIIQKMPKTEVELPQDKRGYRYCILSSFLFLEAFINAEFVANVHPGIQLSELNKVQKSNLDKQLMETSFEEKWVAWVKLMADDDTLKFKGDKFFQELMELKDWRNHLTHYKIHHLMFVAHDLETMEKAKAAVRIVKQTVKWYYSITNLEIPEWVQRDILSRHNSKS